MKTILRGALCALLLTLAAFLASCGSSKPATLSFQAMDTLMSLKVYGGAADLCEKLQDRIEALDALLDATDENSEISRLNTARELTVSADTAALLSESLALGDRLGGSFDLTVYPAVRAWGFTTGEYRVPGDDELSALAERIDYRRVSVDHTSVALPEQTEIDLGAVAKGYAADVCEKLLQETDIQAAVLNLGGTIGLCGQKPDGSRFTVGVADPDDPAAYFGYLSCDACTVATSGGYERYFEQDGKRYIHILDPASARPVDNGVLSVTIVADSGTFADAASTALFVMGLDKAAEYYRQNGGFDFIILTENDDLYITEGIYDDFTLSDGYEYSIHAINKE